MPHLHRGLFAVTLATLLVFTPASLDRGSIPDRGAVAAAPLEPVPSRSLGTIEDGASVPLRFEPNVGQAGPDVDAIARARGYTVALAGADALLSVALPRPEASGDAVALRLHLAGAADRRPRYFDEQPGTTNYIVGADPAKWRTGIRGYGRVQYDDIYPGVDLVFYGNPRELEHDFIVAPGADPSAIVLEFAGADALRVNDDGDLVVTAGGASIRQQRPFVYQDTPSGAKREVKGAYALDGTRVRFAIGDYDRAAPLVIDPVLLVYSTFLGGSGEDAAAKVVADASGSAYVLGRTLALGYPVVNAVQPQHAGGIFGQPPFGGWTANNWDLVVSRFTPDGSALVYSTYLGGSSDDMAQAIAVSGSGEAVVMGTTNSGDFPSAPGYQFGCPCPWGFFLAKLSPSGTALTYVVRMATAASGLAVDSDGNAYLAGWVGEPGPGGPRIPIVNASQPAFGGGAYDAFLLALDTTGTAPLFSTYFGGRGSEGAQTIVLGVDNDIRIAGGTTGGLPGSPGPSRSGGAYDGFIARFTREGQLLATSFLEGPYTLLTGSPVFGADGSLYVAGTTADDGFPAINAMQPARGGQHDAWLVKYATNGDRVYSTYVGGAWPDFFASVAGDAQGRAVLLARTLVGWTSGLIAPGYYPGTWDANWDLAVVKLHASGEVANAVRLGGTYSDLATHLALGPPGTAYLLGTSYSGDFPRVKALRGLTPSVFTHLGEPRPVDMTLTKMTMRMGPWPVTTPVTAGVRQRVTLSGEEFFGNMRVFIGSEWATDVSVVDRQTLTMTVPALPAGVYDIVVVDSYNELATLPNGIVYGTCEFAPVQTPLAFLATGGTRAIALNTAIPICGWAAESSVDWITLPVSSGAGSSSVAFTVSANSLPVSRSAVIAVAGQQVTITQGPAARRDVSRGGVLDLFWQHDGDGRLAAWAMDGAIQINGGPLTPEQVEDVDWKVVGSGDFDGDGEHDLIWQHADGRVGAWLMKGLVMKEGLPLSPASVDDVNWRIRAVGDLNGDGHPDLIWQHLLDGRTAVWLMNGVRAVDGRLLTAPIVEDPGWRIVGAGDFTGSAIFSPPDGRLDILWQHQVDGRVVVWTMDGTTMTGGRELQWYEGWRVRSVADISGDGELDLIVQHDTTRELRFARYNPRVPTGVTLHPLTPGLVDDPGWHLIGPR